MSIINKIKKIISNLKPRLKNAHCVYFEGQTGLCQAKEFKKCNPVHCELYTIDELSTILDLQEKIKAKEQEIEEIKKYLGISNKTIIQRLEELQEYRDKLSEENFAFEGLVKAQENLIDNLYKEIEKWKHQAELYNDTTNRLIKELENKEQVLDEIKRDITSTCENCRQTYYNQHCEECNKGYILNIINEVKANKNKIDSKITNRDKLNRMSNEEFANWLTDNDDASELVNCKMCLFCASDKYDNGKWKCIQCCDEDFRCKQGIEEWLNQKSEE